MSVGAAFGRLRADAVPRRALLKRHQRQSVSRANREAAFDLAQGSLNPVTQNSDLVQEVAMDPKMKQAVLAVLEGAQDMTVATLDEHGAPEASTVSFVSSGTAIYFGCGPDSRKARNLARDPRISVTVNLPYCDWSEICGVGVNGHARRLSGDAEQGAVEVLFLEKFSEIAQYVSTPGQTIALFEIIPDFITLLDYRKGFGHLEHTRTSRASKPRRAEARTGFEPPVLGGSRELRP